jgi:hypothetical protein
VVHQSFAVYYFSNLSPPLVAGSLQFALLLVSHSQNFQAMPLIVLEIKRKLHSVTLKNYKLRSKGYLQFLVTALGNHTWHVRLEDHSCPYFDADFTPDQVNAAASLSEGKPRLRNRLEDRAGFSYL